MVGYIDSIETMGLVDGPGVRVVVFLEGCPLRCIYCHNPEMWNILKKNPITPAALVEKIEKYKEYFKDKGGVTFSGGEPLLQKEFLLECLKLCKEKNINTCIDTAGSIDGVDEILKYTDLVIFDVKATNSIMYNKITGGNIDSSLKFIDTCNKYNKRMWIRSVIVPNVNDNKEYIYDLKKFIDKIKNVEKIELLPYHSYAKRKYKALNIKYTLENTEDMDANRCMQLQKLLEEVL